MDYKELVRVLDSSDERYMAAYRSGDAQRARELLEAHARNVMPDNKVSCMEFFKGANGAWGTKIAGYFTTDYDFAEHYSSGDVRSFYLFMEHPYEYDFKGSGSDGDYEGTDGEFRNTYEVVKEAGDGYDGYILYDVGEGVASGMYDVYDYIEKMPERVKLYDVFTLDDSGELIPLSKRFNLSVADVRY